jgi:polysaccharide biosynthesis/export protein
MNMTTTHPTDGDFHANFASVRRDLRRSPRLLTGAALGICILLAGSGCQAPTSAIPAQAQQNQQEAQTISAGDVLKIEFPGTPTLDTTQQVRRDGRVSLSIIGEVVVTGMTPADLEKDLAKRYSGQLLSSEVNVTVVSSSYSVFVTGAVLRPGKIQPDHPISALEAIMEAGGFDSTKADMEDVTVIRQENGGTKNYSLNLKNIIDGKSSESFYLKPSDIVFVKEKFSWF